MPKGARRRNAGEMTPEQELRMEVLLLKEQLMELQEDYDDLKNDFIRTLIALDMGMYPTEANDVCFKAIDFKLKELGVEK